MKNYYNCIYMYINKLNGKKYVGQAKNFNRRHKTHINSSYNKNTNDYDCPFHRAIRKYGIENFNIIILKENLNSQCLLNMWEDYYVEKYDLYVKNKNGYNVAKAGYNNPYYGKTEKEMSEISNKLSELKKGENHPFYGKKGKEHPKYGKHNSNETNKKISIALSGKNNPKAKRVIQYDSQGNIIKIWDYIKQASEELNINASSISSCCRGTYKSAGGFIWKYEKDVNKNDN